MDFLPLASRICIAFDNFVGRRQHVDTKELFLSVLGILRKIPLQVK